MLRICYIFQSAVQYLTCSTNTLFLHRVCLKQFLHVLWYTVPVLSTLCFTCPVLQWKPSGLFPATSKLLLFCQHRREILLLLPRDTDFTLCSSCSCRCCQIMSCFLATGLGMCRLSHSLKELACTCYRVWNFILESSVTSWQCFLAPSSVCCPWQLSWAAWRGLMVMPLEKSPGWVVGDWPGLAEAAGN